jgi:hypothetical protein
MILINRRRTNMRFTSTVTLHIKQQIKMALQQSRGLIVTGASLSTLALLTACGGGGGDDDSSKASVTPPTTITTPITTPPATTIPTTPIVIPVVDPTSLDDLVVDPDYDLQAAFTLLVQVDLATSQRGYFSLCDDYQQQNQIITVNYESCLLRGALNNGQLNEQLLVANHQRNLMAVVWFYDGSAPQYQQWQYSSDSAGQQLAIN